MGKSKISEDIQKAMIDAYLSGATMEAAAAPFGLTVRHCDGALRRHGAQRRDNLIDDTQSLEMAHLYASGMFSTEIAKRYNCTAESVCNHAKKHGIPIRIGAESRVNGHTCNSLFFRKMETERQAYWLGFLAADGCVSNQCLCLGLQIGDLGHVEKFKADLESTHSIYIGTNNSNHTLCSIRIQQKQLVGDAISLGITPRKSLTCKPWGGPQELMRHYWRGVIDGDGSITGAVNGTQFQWRIALVGSEFMTKGFADWVYCAIGYRTSARKFSDRQLWSCTVTGRKNVIALAQLLYGDATVYLDRKLEKAKEAMAWPEYAPRGPSQEIIEEAISLYKSGVGMNAAAVFVGTNEKAVARALVERGIASRPCGSRPLSKHLQDAAVRMRKEGKNCIEISASLGICRMTVAKYLKLHGHPPRIGNEKGWSQKRLSKL